MEKYQRVAASLTAILQFFNGLLGRSRNAAIPHRGLALPRAKSRRMAACPGLAGETLGSAVLPRRSAAR